jgi:hypothetical protein
VALGLVLSQVFFDYTVIVSCCLIGSYTLFRGIAFFMGGYPSELFIATVAEYGELSELRPTFWMYFSFMIVGFIVATAW